MAKSYVVFGLGEFGISVAKELMENGFDVLACDMDEMKIDAISDTVTGAVVFNALESTAYEKLGLEAMDGAVIGITENLEAAIMAILAAKEAKIPQIIAKAANDTQKEIFGKLGAHKIVMPERDGGTRLARNIVSGSFLDYIELSEKICMIEFAVKESWFGHSLIELHLRERYRLNVIALKRKDKLSINIDPHAPFEQNDIIFIVIARDNLDKLERE